MNKSIVIDYEDEDIRLEYHGRLKTLLMILKKADDDKKVIKFREVKPADLDRIADKLIKLAEAISHES